MDAVPRIGGGRDGTPEWSEPALSVRDLCLSYSNGNVAAPPVIDGLDLDVQKGELVTVIGPSGCGKSTLLRAVADLIHPKSGRLTVFGEHPSQARKRREIGFVFQEPTLLPWRTALQNVALPNEVGPGFVTHKGYADAERLLAQMGLEGREDSYPGQLSGGQRQRVAIARALLSRPRILLMDEPFGALDEITRDRLNDELLRVWRETGITILFVTHSLSEAAYLGQRVLVFSANPGRLKTIIDTTSLRNKDGVAERDTAAFAAATSKLRAALTGP